MLKDFNSKDSTTARRETKKWEELFDKISQKEKEIKKIRIEITKKQRELENKIEEKIESLTEKETKELLLEKFFDFIDNQMNKYLNAEKKELI